MDSIIAFFEHYSESGLIISYCLVFAVLLISGFGVPIPEDITLVTAGILASTQGLYHGFGFFFACMAGVLVGDSIMFFMGYIFGVKILRLRMIRRILTAKRIQTIRLRFQENAIKFLFISRFLPGLRASIYLFSGITRKVSYTKFVLVDFSAAIISVPFWVTMGYLFGNNIDYLKSLVHKIGIGIAIVAIVAALILIFVIRRQITQARIEKDNARLLAAQAQQQEDPVIAQVEQTLEQSEAQGAQKGFHFPHLNKNATDNDQAGQTQANSESEASQASEQGVTQASNTSQTINLEAQPARASSDTSQTKSSSNPNPSK